MQSFLKTIAVVCWLVAFSTSLSACRLQAKNDEKLKALQAGILLDEDGNPIPSPSETPATPPAVTLTADLDPTYFPGESISVGFSVTKQTLDVSTVKLQYSSDGETFSDLVDLASDATSYTWVIPSTIASGLNAKLRISATDTAGNAGAATSNAFKIFTQVSTVAGNGNYLGSRDATGLNARFYVPYGITKMGSAFYVTDDFAVRKVDVSNPSQPVVTTVAGAPAYQGTANGTGSTARFKNLRGITTDGTYLYVSDVGNHNIRRIDPSDWSVITLAGGTSTGTTNAVGTSARFNAPWDLVHVSGALYVADAGNHVIRKVDLGTNTVTTLAGTMGSLGNNNAVGTSAKFNNPIGITSDGSNLYVSDNDNNVIRKIDLGTNTVTTLSGTVATGSQGWQDGTSSTATFTEPGYLTYENGYLYVSETGASALIRKVSTSDGSVTTLAGKAGSPGVVDAVGTNARFDQPQGLVYSGGALYTVSNMSKSLRKIVLSDGSVSTIAGASPNLYTQSAASVPDGLARLTTPMGMLLDGNELYFVEKQTSVIRKVNLTTKQVTTVAGKAGHHGTADGPALSARFYLPDCIVKVGTNFYITDSGNHTIRKLDSSGNVTTVFGQVGVNGTVDATGTSASLYTPTGMVAVGGNLYVTDYESHRIRKIDLGTNAVTTFAGSPQGNYSSGSTDAQGTSARFKNPSGITHDGTYFYVADTLNYTIRRIDSSANVTTIAGTVGTLGNTDGAALGVARFNNPRDVLVNGNQAYITESGVPRVRLLDLGTNTVSTLAGTTSGYQEGTGTTARFKGPWRMVRDGTTLYVSDYSNNAIRAINLGSNGVNTYAGTMSTAGSADGLAYVDSTPFNTVFAHGSEIWHGAVRTVNRFNSDGSTTVMAGNANTPGFTDGTFSNARFDHARGAVSLKGMIYVADYFGHTIRKLNPTTGVVTTLAGTAGTIGTADGNGTSAQFRNPRVIATDGTSLYVGDGSNFCVRKINPDTADVTTFAGLCGTQGAVNGAASAARFRGCEDLVYLNNALYYVDGTNHAIRKIDMSDPNNVTVSTFAGTLGTSGFQDGALSTALIYGPKTLATDGRNFFLYEGSSGLFRKINVAAGTIKTYADTTAIAGHFDGPLSSAGFDNSCYTGMIYTAQGLYMSCYYSMRMVH